MKETYFVPFYFHGQDMESAYEAERESQKKRPGAVESFALSAKRSTDIVAIGKIANNYYDRLNFLHDKTPAGWKPWDEDFFDVPTEYLSALFDARSPGEFRLKKQQMFEEMQEANYLASGQGVGAAVGNFLGSAAGAVFSISSLIPLVGEMKAINAAKGVLTNVARQAPRLAAQAATRNALIVEANQTKDVGDWAKDTFVESIMAGAFVGGMGALRGGTTEYARKILKSKFDGIEVLSEAAEDGTFKGYKAVAIDGSLSSAKVSRAQQIIDEGIAKHGIVSDFLYTKVFSASPIVRGLTSPFGTVRRFTNDMFHHNIVTEKVAKGANREASAEKMSRYWMGRANEAVEQASSIWAEHVGIRGPLKDVQAKISPDAMTRTEFMEQVAYAMRRGDTHSIQAVEQAAKVFRKVYDGLYDDLVRLEVLPANLEPVGALSYLNRVYNKAKIVENPDEFVSNLVNAMSEQNKLIKTIREPLDISNRDLRLAKEELANLKVSKADTKQVRQRIKLLQEEKKKARESIQKEIDAGKVDLSLLEGKPSLSLAESQDLKNLTSKLKALEETIKTNKTQRTKAKDKTERKRLGDEAKKLKEELRAEKERLTIDALDNKINEKFFKVSKAGKIKFTDLNDKPFLRKTVPESELPLVARGAMDTILQESEDQMVERLFKGIKERGTNPLKSRTLLVPDNAIEPWLESDVSKLVNVHSSYLGKYIAFEDVMRRNGGKNAHEGMEAIVNDLKMEYDEIKSDILKESSTPERSEKLLNADKDFKKAEDFIKTSYAIYWGNYNPGKIAGKTGENISAALRGLRNYSAASMLGNLPFLQPTEIFMNIMHHGLWPTIMEGLVPMVKNWKLTKAQASDAGLALNTALNASMEQLWGHGSQYMPKTAWERGTSNIAKFSMNFNLSNQIADGLEVMSATVSQSHSIRSLLDFAARKPLAKKELERLNMLGLGNKEMANRIIAQYKKHGGRIDDAYVSNYHLWDDLKASQVFSMSVQDEVRKTILKPNLLDTPFTFRNEFIASMTQFMSYSWAATNSILIPTLQRPDAQKFTAISMMMSWGAVVPIIRQIQRGEELDLRPDMLLIEAITNSGVLGWGVDAVTKINAAFELPFLKDYKVDRFRNKEAWDLLGGPVGGLLNNAQRTANMFLTGEINETDMKKFAGLFPLTGTWYLRWLTDNYIKSMGLPKNKREAIGYFEE